MKNYLLRLLLTGMFAFAPALFAAEFEEGTHYEVIAQAEPSSQAQITEFFSFGCPSCFRFEPVYKQVTAKLSDDVEVKKSHVNFLGFASKELQNDLGRALVLAKTLKVSDKVNTAFFDFFHVERARLESRDDIRDILIANGVSAADFDQHFDGFAVSMAVKKMERDVTKNQVSGVPKVIVNEKYTIIGGVSSIEEYTALVNYLLTNPK